MIRTLLVDDEPLAVRRLEIKLSRYPDIDIIGYSRDGDAAIKAMEERLPDLVFLDINMPGADGLEVARKAQALNVHVIFVTAFNQYAVQAFEKQAVDYLLKPVSAHRLDTAIERYRNREKQENALDHIAELNSIIAQFRNQDSTPLTPPSHTNIWIKDKGNAKKITMEHIEWVEASRDYVSLHMINGRNYFVRNTMSHFEKILDTSLFQRVHRSSIVNLIQLKEIHNHDGRIRLVLRSGAKVRVGRSYKSKTTLRVKELFPDI